MAKKRNTNVSIATIIIAVVIAFCGGFVVGMKFGPQKVIKMTPTDLINEGLVDMEDPDSVAFYDSIDAAKEARIKQKVDSITRLNEQRNDSLKRVKRR